MKILMAAMKDLSEVVQRNIQSAENQLSGNYARIKSRYGLPMSDANARNSWVGMTRLFVKYALGAKSNKAPPHELKCGTEIHENYQRLLRTGSTPSPFPALSTGGSSSSAGPIRSTSAEARERAKSRSKSVSRGNKMGSEAERSKTPAGRFSAPANPFGSK